MSAYINKRKRIYLRLPNQMIVGHLVNYFQEAYDGTQYSEFGWKIRITQYEATENAQLRSLTLAYFGQLPRNHD